MDLCGRQVYQRSIKGPPPGPSAPHRLIPRLFTTFDLRPTACRRLIRLGLAGKVAILVS
jgi:hypothetical protein